MKTELTCPSGHTVKVEELSSYVKLNEAELDDAITFSCAGGKRGHNFSLRKAVACGMFNIEQAARIRASGAKHLAQFQEKGKVDL